MQIVRVFTGDDNESHFEDVAIDQLAEIVSRVGAGPVNLNRRASPAFSDFHNAPRRQYVVVMAGVYELEAGDGSRRRLQAGDVLVAEDVTGHGHILRGIGDEPRVALAVPLAD